MGAFLTYALDEGGAPVHVDAVPTGAKCACHCPYCNAPLYAKNAGKTDRAHHFAHAHRHNCEGAFESSLHHLAKEILQEAGRIMLPPSNYGTFPTGSVGVHNVEIEKWDARYGIRPDAECIMDNGERLLIEFYVSHKVDGKKRQVIIDNHLKCIEININYQILDKAELKEFLTSSQEDRQWIVAIPPKPKSTGYSLSYGRNPLYDMSRDVLYKIFREGTIIIYPFSSYHSQANKPFNLRQLGYNECDLNAKHRGIKSDLLLYRKEKNDKGYISINFRGRRRNTGFRYPKGLRIIDIIFGTGFTGEFVSKDIIEQVLHKGDLIADYGITVEYHGFVNKTPSSNPPALQDTSQLTRSQVT